MSAPLVLYPYTRVEGIHRVEVGRLSEGKDLVNIVLKYDPSGSYSPSTNGNGVYNKTTGKFELKQFFAYSGSEPMPADVLRRRIEDLEKVLQDQEVIDYIARIS